jgi:hypothetical protein
VINNECRYPTPGSVLVGDGDEEDGGETQESTTIICDEHLRAMIGKHRREPV